MQKSIADLIEGARQALPILQTSFDKATNDAQKRRIMRITTKLEKAIAELSDRFEPVL